MNYATWFPRVGAAIIDGLPVWALMGIGYAIDGGVGAIYFIFALLGVAFSAYNRWFMGGQGASIGKKALGLKLVGEQSGQPLGFGGALIRDIAHAADAIICYIGFLFPLWDAKKQTIADKLAKSLVLKV
jgi:uncharacterized RDD family membrane protein YckC